MILRTNVALLVLMSLTSASVAADSKSPVGMQVENFTLKDYRGKQHSLDDYRDSKFVVLVVTGTECPLVKLYSPRLQQLADAFAPKGVAFLAINANRHDSITEIAAHARVHGVKFPILKDLGNRIVDKLGAVRTPEVYLLDEQRIVRYHGRIDNQYGVGYIRNEATRFDLKQALTEITSGEPISVAKTEAPGCFIGRIREADEDSQVTYSNQIARIFQKRCVECHREGEIAPFTLTEYEEVVGWAETIAEVIDNGRMPPWHANPKHGSFINDRSMTQAEKQLVYDWVDAGAPEGDPQQLPKPVEYASGWQLPSEPDQVIHMQGEPFTVKAEGEVRYQYFTVDPGFTEDTWIQAAQALPGNRAVVHHILVMVKPPGGPAKYDQARSDFLAGYVPGLIARPFPKGMAKFVPAGSKLVFQMHYTPIGSVQQDRSRVGLIFADPKEIDHIVATTKAINHRFEIPPHAHNHRVEATSGRAPAGTQVLSFMPHLHLRGKDFRYEAHYPDGKKEILLDIPLYDFNWQTAYWFAEPKKFPAGTRMHCVAHFNNSDTNLANPDPGKTVRWGDQTWEEMMIGYFDIAIPVDPQQYSQRRQRGGSGRVTRALRQASQTLAEARKLVKKYDANGDGQVARDEVPAKLLPTYDKLDLDDDKTLTAEEIVKANVRRKRD